MIRISNLSEYIQVCKDTYKGNRAIQKLFLPSAEWQPFDMLHSRVLFLDTSVYIDCSTFNISRRKVVVHAMIEGSSYITKSQPDESS